MGDGEDISSSAVTEEEIIRTILEVEAAIQMAKDGEAEMEYTDF